MTKTETNRLDKLFGKIILEDQNYQCELCGERRETHMNPHHIFSRRARSTRWYLPNGCCLCSGCHTLKLDSAHRAPFWYKDEMVRQRGVQWEKDLQAQWNKTSKADYVTVFKYLNGELNNYC